MAWRLTSMKRLTSLLFAVVLYAAPILAQADQKAFKMDLSSPRLVVLQGITIPAYATATDGVASSAPIRCRFKYHVPAGIRGMGWRQLGDPLYHEDGKTCEAAFQEGELTADSLAAAGATSDPFACSGRTYCRVRFTSTFEDVFNIETTHLGSEVAWNYTQFCGDGFCARYIAGGLDPYALLITGNHEIRQWGYTGLNMSGLVPWVGYTGSASFYNDFFPGCSPTYPMYAYYNPVEVYGYPDGSFDGWETSWTDGAGCRFLLHHAVYFTVLSTT